MRRLSSVETLGSVTVICSDKTGTFTKNEMTVKKLFFNNKIVDITGTGYKAIGDFLVEGKKVDPKQFKLLLMIGALNNNSSFDKEKVIGDPTEACLLVSAKKSGLNLKYLQDNNKRIDELEFTSERKIMTTIHKTGKKRVIFTKGAPDFVLEKCNRMIVNGKIKKMTIQDRKNFLEMNKNLASEALRVLAFAYKEFDHPNNYEKNLIFVGLQGMIDPARDEVKKAVADCNNAGIRVVMITGDNEETAKAIAKEIGIEGKSINGKDIDNINLEKEVGEISIYARVNPSHKMDIVDALQKKNQIVAMTGDGVNDAPALKKADIGIAMGITGTDVSKEAADMVLTDDNFASIVKAIEQGRGVYDNIRKFIALLLSGNIGEVMIIFIALLIGLPLPLIAIQILLINLITDGLPATALSADPFEPGAMKRKPKKVTSQLYQNLYPYLVVYPTLMIIVVLSLFTWFLKNDSLVKAQTVAFLCVGLFELYQAFSCRSIIYPVFKVGVFKNKWLNLAILSSLMVLFAVVFVPFFQNLFSTVSLSLFELFIVLILSSIGAVYLEIHKMFRLKAEVRT